MIGRRYPWSAVKSIMDDRWKRKKPQRPHTRHGNDTERAIRKLLVPPNISIQVSRKDEGKGRNYHRPRSETSPLVDQGEKSARRTPIGVDDRHELQNRTVDVLPFVKVFRARV